MIRIREKIKNFFRRLYKYLFKKSIFSYGQKKLISHIIQKYQNIDYEEKIGGEESMSYYTRGFMATLLETKTFNYIFSWYLKNFVYPGILTNIKEAVIIQKNILKHIIEEIKYTEFAKSYHLDVGMDDIYKEYIGKVPIVNYEEFQKWIEKAKKNPDVLWPWKITKFSASAWTTSRKKNIPVTDEILESTSKAGLDMLATYVMRHPSTDIFSWYYRPLVWTIQEQFEDGSIMSDMSALLVLDRNSTLQNKYKYQIEMLLEPNRCKKRELFLKHMDPKEKTIMVGVTSRVDEMLRYIQEQDSKKFTTFIKNLSLVIRGWVSAKPYIKFFNEHKIHNIGVYNTSEGCFGYQDVINYSNDEAQAPYQLLVNHGSFYEFIPFTSDNFENGELKSNSTIKPLREITQADIDKKTKFALVITTNAWLFRYLLGDVIRFVDKEWRFEIVGRTKQCINLKGEELMEDYINSALYQINEKYSTDFKNYTIWPDSEDQPTCHEWILEWDLPTDIDQEKLIHEIDKILQKINADYEAKRTNDILLKLPKITFVPKWTFTRRLKSNKKLWGQYKIPKLADHKTYINEILSLNSKT